MITQENLTSIFFMRHGETPSNQGGMNGGGRLLTKSDQGLTNKGITDTEESVRILRKYGLRAIIAPDQPRFMQTAGIIARAIHLPIITDDSFRERYYGDLEGMQYSEVANQKNEWLSNQSQPNIHGIESDSQLEARFVPALNKIAWTYLGASALVITGSGMMKFTYSFIEQVPIGKIMPISIENNTIMELVFNNLSNTFSFEDKLA